MVSKEILEKTATTLASMSRRQLTSRIQNFKGRFKLDFTEEYLSKLTTDRLRHILLAALLSAKSPN